MATITENYVPFETAKLLKEKGFDEHCFCINYPLPEGGHHNIILPNLLNNSTIPLTNEYKFCRYKEDFITIPTLQMAMKWLREEKNIIINVWYNGVDWDAEHYNNEDENFYLITDSSCNSYEQAVEAALKYSLENLI